MPNSLACEGKYRRHLRVHRIGCRQPDGSKVSRVLFRSPTCLRCGAERQDHPPGDQLQSVATTGGVTMGDVQTGVGRGRLFTEDDARALLLFGEIHGFQRCDKTRENAPGSAELLRRFDEKHGDVLTFGKNEAVMAMSIGAVESLIRFAVGWGVERPQEALRTDPTMVLEEWLKHNTAGGSDG